MTRVPSDHPDKLESNAVAERMAGTVRRYLLTAAQTSLRAVREILAHFPKAESVKPKPPAEASAAAIDRPVQRPARAVTEPVPRSPSAAELLQSGTPLPLSYGSDRLVLLARDPHCLYAYWDLSEALAATVRLQAGSEPLRLVLRTYDVTQIAFDAGPPKRFQDFALSSEARSHYAYIGKPASCFVAEVGYLRSDGAFFPLTRSQPIWTPRTDQPGAAPGRWMTVGWNQRREAGAVVPLATSGTDLKIDPGESRTVTQQAPSSWSAYDTATAQRGSWSLVRGGLGNAIPSSDSPAARSDS